MGTSLVRFTTSESEAMHWGVLGDEGVHPLALASNHHRDIMMTYFERRDNFDAAVSPASIAVSDLRFEAPLAQDIQLLCQGVNYADHRQEGGLKRDGQQDQNLIFQKASSSICAPDSDIIRPQGCQLLDYEIELGLVLKADISRGAQISEDNLGQFVGGLVIGNDVSARDVQFGATLMQWYRGKSYDTFCPCGPVLYLLDSQDMGQLYTMKLSLMHNGELKQQAVTEQLIHKPPAALTDLASFMGARAGDCLLTGTPGGVLFQVDRKTAMAIAFNLKNNDKRQRKLTKAQLARQSFLQPGDELQLSIVSEDGRIDLGTQRNKVVEAG